MEVRRLGWISEYYYLLKINILELRKSWIFQLIFGFIMPFGIMFILSTYIDTSDEVVVVNLFIGNIITSVTMPILLLLTSRLSQLKSYGSMDYYKSLPINLNTLAIALMSTFFLTYIPTILTLCLLFHFWLGMSFSITILLQIILCLLLVVFSLVGIASFIGLKAKTPEQANVMGNVVFAILITTSPVLIPIEKLPEIFNYISKLTPTNYGINVAKGILLFEYNSVFYISLGVLLLMSALSFWALQKVVKS